MGILRADRITGLGGANAITGSTYFVAGSGTSHGQYLRVEDLDGDFKFGTSDFTIEFWMNTPTVDTSDIGAESSLATMLDHGYGFSENATGAWWVLHHKDDTLIWGFNGSNQLTTSSFIKVNTWHHIAVVRTGGNTKIYADGTQVGTVSDGQNYTDALARPLDIGSQTYQTTYRNYEGFISNLRIINGTALYTSAFTPPTTRLTKTSDTVLLTCNSVSNILHEETGKNITPNRNTVNSSYATARRDTPNTPVGFSTTTDVGSQYGSTFDGFGSFATSTYMVPPGGNTRERNRGRGLVGGGYSPSVLGQIYSVEIASDGTSADFGDLTLARRGTGAVGSHTRGIWAGGYAPGYQDRIDFVTFASTANAIDFGNLDTNRFETSGVSNDTRGVYGASENPGADQSVIQYITMATAGNAIDFGDSTVATKKQASMNSTTRGLFAGGQNVPSPLAYYDIIDKITIASTGNAADFGDLTENVFMCTGVSDSTRGIRGGGAKSPSPANTDTIDYVTIASDGNATDFGNLTTANQRSGGMSNSLRGLFAGGATPNSSTAVNSIDKITIQTTGNATDFGDYIGTAATQGAGCSDSHGGLS